MKQIKKLSLVFIVSFVLNAIWEFSHYRLYYDLFGIPSIRHLWGATFTDAIYVLGFFIIISLIHRDKKLKWMEKPGKFDYFMIFIFGLITAIIIEVWALGIGRWAYRSIMPTIFGIGLSPLVQLAVTGIITLWIINNYKSFFNFPKS